MHRIIKFIIAKKRYFFLLVLLLPCLFLLKFPQKEKEKPKDSATAFPLESFIKNMLKKWEVPDQKDFKKVKSSCPHLFRGEFPLDFYSCNPLYLSCLIKAGEFANKKVNFIKNHRNNLFIQDYPNTVSVTLKAGEEEHFIKLKKHCHQKELPKNIYSAGPEKLEKYVWDNSLQKILIDRYYVSIFDAYLWAIRENKKELIKKYFSPEIYSDPVIDFTAKQMKNYCRDHKKNVMKSRILDAASYYPNGDMTKFKFPFPWTKKRKSFLNDDSDLAIENCENAFIRGCEEFKKFKNYTSLGISWIGIANSLGGYPEYVENDFFPRGNLKVSSKTLPKDSEWHRVGVRAYWDGEEFNHKNFEMTEQYTNRKDLTNGDIKGVAFRCVSFTSY